MGERFDIEAALRDLSPRSRREFLKQAAFGISGPAALALLAACGGEGNGDGGTGENGEPTATRQTVPGATVATGDSDASPTTGEGEPKQGGTMIVMGHHELASLSPDDAGPTVHWVVVTQLHNALLELDENYVLQPTLAESFEVADDNLSYTFKLRQGVKFHDGEEFTSEDVKYTFEWYMNPDNAAINANNFRAVESVEAPDDYTAIIKMKEPDATFLALGATTFIVPAHYHREIGEDEYKSKPIGTGPFKLKEWSPNSHTVVEAFDDHFRGRPHLDAYRENIVPEASVRAIALETGEADSAVWPLVSEDNLRFAEDENYTTFVTSAVSCNHFLLNNKLPQLSDKRVRQAMMFAIDRQKVIDDVFQGTAVLATSNLSPAIDFYYEPDVKQYTYDPEQAKQLLEEAGWVDSDGDGIREKDGTKLTFTCTTITGDQARKPEAEVVQQYLRDVGIDMQLAEAPLATILEGLRSGDMDASLFNWTHGGTQGDPDASTTLRSGAGNNFFQYENPRVDELLDLGMRETDPEKRKQHYSEIQKIIAEDVPFLFMMFWDWYNIFTSRIKGLPEKALNGDAIYAKAYQFWIEE